MALDPAKIVPKIETPPVELEARLKDAEKKPQEDDIALIKANQINREMSDLSETQRVDVSKLIASSGMNFKQSLAVIEIAKSLTKPTKPPAEKPSGGVPLAAVSGIEKHFNVLDFHKEREERKKK